MKEIIGPELPDSLRVFLKFRRGFGDAEGNGLLGGFLFPDRLPFPLGGASRPLPHVADAPETLGELDGEGCLQPVPEVPTASCRRLQDRQGFQHADLLKPLVGLDEAVHGLPGISPVDVFPAEVEDGLRCGAWLGALLARGGPHHDPVGAQFLGEAFVVGAELEKGLAVIADPPEPFRVEEMGQGLAGAEAEGPPGVPVLPMFHVEDVQKPVGALLSEGDGAAARVIPPGHEETEVGQAQDLLLEIFVKGLGAAVADADVPQPRDIFEADPGDIPFGVPELGDARHEDQKDVRRFHGEVPDGVAEPSRVDEAETRRVVHGDRRVEPAAEVGGGGEGKDDKAVPGLVAVMGVTIGIGFPAMLRASRVKGAQGGVDDGARRDGKFILERSGVRVMLGRLFTPEEIRFFLPGVRFFVLEFHR